MKPRKASNDSAMDAVTTAKMANGMDTVTMTNGATAYNGFHGLSSMLNFPRRNNMADGVGAEAAAKALKERWVGADGSTASM